MSNWVKRGDEVVAFVVSFGVGIGIAALILGALFTATTGTAAVVVNTILQAVSTSVTSVAGPLITIALVLLIYVLAKSAGIGQSGGKGKHE